MWITHREELAILAVLWIAYCFIHSLLIADSVKERAERLLGERFRFYRLTYNALSVILLLPVLLYRARIESRSFLSYHGLSSVFPVLLVSGGLFLFYLGAKAYDMKEFLGLRQIGKRTSPEGDNFSNDGILAFVRHPWYMAGIMVIWGRDLDSRALVTNAVLTLYFIVGSYLEERKLLRRFGDQYRLYRQEVSMLLPFKWAKKKLGTTRGISGK